MELFKKKTVLAALAILAIVVVGLLFIRDSHPPRDYQVDIDLVVDGKPLHLSRVLHCERQERWNEGWGRYVAFSLSPKVRVFGQRLENNNAIIVWTPNACGMGLVKRDVNRNPKDGDVNDDLARRSDGRLANIEFAPDIPEGNLPMIGWIENADQPDEILLYASPRAYENQYARIKFKKISIVNPDLGRPVDKPDEFAWLGTTDIPKLDKGTHREARHNAYCLFPIKADSDIAKQFWDKVDRNKKEVQVIEPFGHLNGDIGLAFELPSSAYEYGASLWGDWYLDKAAADKQKGNPKLFDCYPVRLERGRFEFKPDMFGFVYAYDESFLKHVNKDFIPIRFSDAEELLSNPYKLIVTPASGGVVFKSYLYRAFYVPSQSQIFVLSGASFFNHKPPSATKAD